MSKGLCSECSNNRKKPNCPLCGGKVSKSAKMCRACYNNQLKSAKELKNKKKAESKTVEPKKAKSKDGHKICTRCMEDQVIVEDEMCEGCYFETVERAKKKKFKRPAVEDSPIKQEAPKKKKSKRPAVEDSPIKQEAPKKKKRRMVEVQD